MRHRRQTATTILLFTVAAAPAGGSVVYVDASATGPAHDGSTWCSGFTDLQDALEAARQSSAGVTEIRVADGVYLPDRGSGDRRASFTLVSGVALRGGYTGCGADEPDLRSPALHISMLSGDLAGDDGPGFAHYEENSLHVVTANGTSADTILDGFAICGGNASEGSPTGSQVDGAGAALLNEDGSLTVRSCIFVANRSGPIVSPALADAGAALTAYAGGAVYNGHPSQPQFEDCVFKDNAATLMGGAMYCAGSGTVARLRRCTFDSNSALQGGGAIGLYSHAGAELVDCTLIANAGGGLRAIGGGRLGMTGCTVERNRTSGSSDPYTGAGISGALTEVDVHASYFSANQAGIAMSSVRSAAVVDCDFVDNLETGVYMTALSARFDGSRFIRNGRSASGRQPGGSGLIIGVGSIVAVIDSTFEDNQTQWDGGAVNSSGPLTMRRCVFADNTAGRSGGAVNNDWSFDVDESWFTANSAVDGSAVFAAGRECAVRRSLFEGNYAAGGGTVSLRGEASLVQGCRFVGNFAGVHGGALTSASIESQVLHSLFSGNVSRGFGGAISHTSGSMLLRGCTIAGNHAEALGGGMIAAAGANIENTILWGNLAGNAANPIVGEFAQVEGGPTPAIAYSLVEGWTGHFGGVGNGGDDPLFVDVDGADDVGGSADDDLRVEAASPAINAGDPSFVGDTGEPDVAGRPRVLCARVDVGAFEFGIGDVNCDRLVDLDDFTGWGGCATGPGQSLALPECAPFDFNADSDRDLGDFAGFLSVFGE
ncbi:MAG: right-handed parallel beta-helix repeat-containing protein [Planctomycetes bacterium]|nr:right-handed parallel beta-helix repeat-containing protein [Planctomycetota bacterium]